MHNAYKVRSHTDINMVVLKYVIFIILVIIIYSAMNIPYDVKIGFSKDSRQNFPIKMQVLQYCLFIQMVVFAIGMVLYYLVNKRCCEKLG